MNYIKSIYDEGFDYVVTKDQPKPSDNPYDYLLQAHKHDSWLAGYNEGYDALRILEDDVEDKRFIEERGTLPLICVSFVDSSSV